MLHDYRVIKLFQCDPKSQVFGCFERRSKSFFYIGDLESYLNHIGDLECFFYMEQSESPVPNRETKDNFTHEKTKRVAIQCHKGKHYYL